MKTLSLFNIKNTFRVLSLLFGFILASCGSYHNSSYYDSDGIYSRTEQYASQDTPQEDNRQVTGSYFTQFQDYYIPSEEPVGIFTDVDSYYGSGEAYSTGYSGWGNSVTDVSVNIYGGGLGWGGWYGSWGWGSPYWGYGWGWSTWYNPYWGWNSWYNPYWGWNYGWGGYYPYYGNYTYHRGPRNAYYSDYGYGYGSRAMRTSSVRSTRSVNQNRAYEVRGRGQNVTPTRSDSRFTTNATRTNTVQNTREVNSTRSSAIENNRSTRNGTINNNRSNTNTRSSTINSNRNINRNNTINNNRSNNTNNRSGSFNSNRNNSSSPSMNRGGSMGGGRSSGMGGGSTRSSSGGRR